MNKLPSHPFTGPSASVGASRGENPSLLEEFESGISAWLSLHDMAVVGAFETG